MQDPAINEGLTSSWENVHKMPDKADAALVEFEETKAGTEALVPTKERRGAQEAEGQTDESIATGEDIEWILEDCEDPAESEQDCFEGDAEVIQDTHKGSSLHFEEEDTCVHPSKPDFDEAARTECDSGSEGDPEASSLAGSDCEYAFILDRPNAKLADADKDAHATPDKGRSMPQTQRSSPQGPSMGLPNPSSQLLGTLIPSAARSASQSHTQSPALDYLGLPCIEEGASEKAGRVTKQNESSVDMLSQDGAEAAQASAPGVKTEHSTDEGLKVGGDAQDGISSKQSTKALDKEEAASRAADNPESERNDISHYQPLLILSSAAAAETSCCSEEPLACHTAAAQTVFTPDLPLIKTTAQDTAAQRRRQLDKVGVIPGGRAAFGAKLPCHKSTSGGASSSSAASNGQRQKATRLAPPALPELVRPAAPNWARPHGRGSGSSGSGASGAGAAAAMLPLWTGPGPAALDRRRGPRAARRLEVRALPAAMLECYDSLWHGNSAGIVASQS